MQPTAFDEETDVLNPPKGVPESQVQSLSVFRNGEIVVSCWKPSKEELDEINRTGRVWLLIWGITMPPALLMGSNPFDTRDQNSGPSGSSPKSG